MIARFMGPTWGPFGADRTQVAPWTLLWSRKPLLSVTNFHKSKSGIKYSKTFVLYYADLFIDMCILVTCMIRVSFCKVIHTHIYVYIYKHICVYICHWKSIRNHKKNNGSHPATTIHSLFRGAYSPITCWLASRAFGPSELDSMLSGYGAYY